MSTTVILPERFSTEPLTIDQAIAELQSVICDLEEAQDKTVLIDFLREKIEDKIKFQPPVVITEDGVNLTEGMTAFDAILLDISRNEDIDFDSMKEMFESDEMCDNDLTIGLVRGFANYFEMYLYELIDRL